VTAIEPVTSAGAAVLAVLHAAAFPEEPWSEQTMATILSLPGCFALVATDGGVPVGCIMARDLGDECEILSLGVDPERRRRGCGVALLRATLSESRRRGCRSAVLEVAEDNLAALALYAATGFQRVGRRPCYYRRGKCYAEGLILRIGLPPISANR